MKAPIAASLTCSPQTRPEVARLLLARGADVTHRQEGGLTALHGAVQAERSRR